MREKEGREEGTPCTFSMISKLVVYLLFFYIWEEAQSFLVISIYYPILPSVGHRVLDPKSAHFL
jgi:hypothetical protein